MMKLNILNMTNFLEIINSCQGEVNILRPDGKRVNISRQYTIQDELQKEYQKNKYCLPLTLDVSKYQDYMSIVYYYVGDC